MPVVLSGNVTVYPESKEEGRRTRRKTRLSVYLNKVHCSTDDDFNIFNETDVQNVLEEQQERKKKLQTDEKLKLVWKGKYNYSKTPQEALHELLAQRSTATTQQRNKVRFNTPESRNIVSCKTYSRHSTSLSLVSADRNSSNRPVDTESASKLLAKWSELSCDDLLSNTVKTDEEPLDYENDRLTHEVSSITQGRPSFHTMRRYSRSIFTTKKATDNQERNMFSYRAEKKRPNTVKKGQKKDSTDAMKAVQLEREKLMPELKSKVHTDTLLRAYLSEQFLELYLEGPEAADMRSLYKAAILDQPVVHNLIMKHPDMLPSRIFKDLVTYKKGFEVNPIYSPTVVKSDEGPWREFYRKTLSSATGNVMIELEKDLPMYANFYKNLLERRAENINIDESWVRERKSQPIREKLLHTAVNLRIARQNPGSTARFDMLPIFAAAGRNSRLLRQLGLTIEGWLSQLVKGLFSPFKSVRDETCQVLCFMISYYPVMRELYVSKYFDVVHDLSSALLRAIDANEDSFPEYYMLLAHIIHYCPSRSTIESIIDRWTNFRCIGMILRWPRLIYYALRYWPDDVLCLGSRFFSMRLTKALDTAIQRPLTARLSRNALFYLQARMNSVSRLFTINYNKETAQSSFMAALAV